MAEFDLVVKNGMVVDGTRAPRFRSDIGIKNGRIAKIGRISAHQGAKVVDAGGQIVAPGFIDLHTHYDAQIFWDPYLTISGYHGVTSVVLGNCGFGFAPVRPKEAERAMLTMVRTEAVPLKAMQAAMPFDWESYPQFMDKLDQVPKGVNLLPYVPMNPVLGYVMGIEESKTGRMPTDDEHAAMRRILHEAMDAGACGWSAQRLIPGGPSAVQRDFDGSPMNTDVMHDETCLEMARVLGERGEGFQELTLASWDPRKDAEHFEQIAEVSGRPIMYEALVTNDRFPHRHRNTMRWLERCRQKGLPVYGQGTTTDAGLTFTFEDWNLFDDSDAWRAATTGKVTERTEKLGDPRRRAALKAQFFAPAVNSSDLMKELLDYPYITFGVSDGGAHTKFLTAGRYPTEGLIRFVREKGWMTLEDIHWRMSGLPAFCAGFKDRGFLREGAPADIVIYNLDKLAVLPVEIVHDLPGDEWRRIQRAEGYQYVIVNGAVTWENDQFTGAHPGKVLRHGVSA